MLIYLSALETERDRDYFREIYEANCRKMFHVAMMLLKEPTESENAVHEAFLSIAERFEHYGKLPRRELEGLCITITKNKVIDYVRQRKHLSDKELDKLFIGKSDPDHDPQQRLERNDKVSRVRRVMEQLPEIMQVTLELKYYYQYSNPEIAEILGVSLRTVEMRLYRAKIKMRELMKHEKDE